MLKYNVNKGALHLIRTKSSRGPARRMRVIEVVENASIRSGQEDRSQLKPEPSCSTWRW
jgi:hypothetical protein